MRVAVFTVDQRGSSGALATDRVPDTLAGLSDVAMLRPFERTAGDEFQGVLDDPESLAVLVERLLREDDWSIGIGIGEVDAPLPDSTRAGRGDAFVHARAAVTAAKKAPHRTRVIGGEATRALETIVWLWAVVLERRTAGGWELADQVEGGASYDEAARRLGVTPSAISQRAQAAGIVEGRRARELVVEVAERLLRPGSEAVG